MRNLVLPFALVLASCGSGEGAAAPTPQTLAPQPIGFPEIEANNIYGASCVFVPEGGGLGTIFIGEDEVGWLKLDGKVIKLAADPGSAELHFGARNAYAGDGYSVALAATGDGKQTGDEVVDYAGRLTIRDPTGAVLFDASGLTECGA